MELDLSILVIVLIAFLVSGMVKGVVGFGLPAVSLAILSIALDLHSAIALVIVPAFVTNIRQSCSGGHLIEVFNRAWPFFFCTTISVWLGAIALATLNHSFLSAVLGSVLVFYAVISISGKEFKISNRNNAWLGPFLGGMTGLFAGMTGTASVPGIMYLKGIGFSRDSLVQAMGMLFTLCALVLGIAMQKHNMLTLEIVTMSCIALIPALLGMLVGERTRKAISEQAFKNVFLFSLLIMGVYILIDSVDIL
jgi:uncharacterized membrane protein YfcA